MDYRVDSILFPLLSMAIVPVVENDTVFSQFQIGYNPCADFTFFNTTACNGTMSFTDLTYNPGTSWKWFFW